MKDILIIIPTRERPLKIEELYQSWKAHTKGRSTLLFVLEADDPLLNDYPRYDDCLYLIGNFGNMVKALNSGYEKYPDYSYYLFMGDDHRFRTSFEDEMTQEGVVYGDDLFQHDQLPTACLLSGDLVREMGYIALPTLHHLYVDNFWLELGKRKKLTYLPNVVIEHLHPAAGKAQMDYRYQIVNSQEMINHDHEEFLKWRDK